MISRFLRRWPLALALLLFAAAAARAGDPLRIVTVDMKRVFEEYWKYGESKELLDAKSKGLNQELDGIEGRYEELVAQLRKLKAELDSPALNEQARLEKGALLDKLAQNLRAMENQVKQRKVDLIRFRDAEREKLLKELTGLIRNFAIREKIDLVLDSGGGAAMGPSTLIYASAGFDATDRVLAAINEGHEKKGGVRPPPAEEAKDAPPAAN